MLRQERVREVPSSLLGCHLTPEEHHTIKDLLNAYVEVASVRPCVPMEEYDDPDAHIVPEE